MPEPLLHLGNVGLVVEHVCARDDTKRLRRFDSHEHLWGDMCWRRRPRNTAATVR